MAHQFLGIPKYVAPEVYENTVDKIVANLTKDDSVLSIYRLGNVNHPGISDLDLVVLFKDGSTCELNPDRFLNAGDKYLLTHAIFGASVDQFKKVIHYSFWDNLKCIWGEAVELDDNQHALSDEETTFYKAQVGLEYLQKNYIDLSVQRKYGVIKLRSLIQEIKGIRYDLDFLDIKGLKINECISEFLHRLDHWFDQKFNPNEFSLWLNQYYFALEEAINHVNNQGKTLWVPKEEGLRYGKNVILKKGEKTQCITRGIFLPSILIAKDKKIYNAHQRLNSFEITLKYSSKDPNGLNVKRFNAFEAHKRETRMRFPHFGALLSSLPGQFI